MIRTLRIALILAAALACGGRGASAQKVNLVGDQALWQVMPDADRFDRADGDPPVRRAYRGDELIGYVFLTGDIPPEVSGYSGPINTLVGVTTEGLLTGVLATEYRESRRYEWGDFLAEPSYLRQYVGKSASDRFGILQDIDGISGVTITVQAMARGVRDAARRVALAYLPPPAESPATISEDELTSLSWYEMRRRGVAVTMMLRQTRRDPVEISLIHISSDELARHLLGSSYPTFASRVEKEGGADQIVLYVVGGADFVAALRTGWSVEQGGRTVAIPRERVVVVGTPGGVLSRESPQVGALLLDDDEVDIRAPMTFAYDRGRPEQGIARVEYTTRAAHVRIAEATPPIEAEPAFVADAPTAAIPRESAASVVAETPTADAEPSAMAATAVPAAPELAAPAARPSAPAALEPSADDAAEVQAIEPEGLGTAWPRLPWMILVIALASLAFFSKKDALRWVSLATTMVVLGWIDGGFLSISHVTGLIWVGFSAVRSDPSLLLLAGFVVATVVLWGRVFCGYLCPFGALQDFVDRMVPRRFKRELPVGTHRWAWKAKYGVLALILGAALLGVETSLYQYFEPFGTVFFLSPSLLLWAIAGAILVASAVIPRFYCRYACPLGALLAVGSLVSLRRIRRVEQCGLCRVCEQKCPTGAVQGAHIHFGECVRCNVCEIQLIERTGVCRHEMEDVRPRLVQIRRETVTSGT